MSKKNIIVELSIEFALSTIKLYKALLDQKEYIMSKQLLRSSTSIGANIHEAISAESKKDFIHKLSISLKEARETKYWLVLLNKSGYLKSDYQQIDTIIKILVSIILTSKQKDNSEL